MRSHQVLCASRVANSNSSFFGIGDGQELSNRTQGVIRLLKHTTIRAYLVLYGQSKDTIIVSHRSSFKTQTQHIKQRLSCQQHHQRTLVLPSLTCSKPCEASPLRAKSPTKEMIIIFKKSPGALLVTTDQHHA